jgi:hypothetical protein
MKRLAPVILVGLFGLSSATGAEPISFQEISLLLRTGENQQTIVNDITSRKLLQPLTAEQDAMLRAAGASPALLTALRAPETLASPDAVALYRAHHQATPVPAPAVAIAPAAPAVPAQPAPAPAPQKVVLPDLFTAGLENAKKAPAAAMQMTYAFGLDRLDAAKAKAQREHKPLGFIMVWDQYFNKRATTRVIGGSSALLHFYEAFKDSLVLVFVHHENELDKVPRAVAFGFQGPDEGGYAPNMAVVDATATQFIVEIPCAGPGGAGPERDAVFKMAAAKIQTWMNAHPTAVAAPASAATR